MQHPFFSSYSSTSLYFFQFSTWKIKTFSSNANLCFFYPLIISFPYTSNLFSFTICVVLFLKNLSTVIVGKFSLEFYPSISFYFFSNNSFNSSLFFYNYPSTYSHFFPNPSILSIRLLSSCYLELIYTVSCNATSSGLKNPLLSWGISSLDCSRLIVSKGNYYYWFDIKQ